MEKAIKNLILMILEDCEFTETSPEFIKKITKTTGITEVLYRQIMGLPVSDLVPPHISYERVVEIATLEKDGLIEDGEEEAIEYLKSIVGMSSEEAAFFGVDLEDEVNIDEKRCFFIAPEQKETAIQFLRKAEVTVDGDGRGNLTIDEKEREYAISLLLGKGIIPLPAR